MSNSLFKDLIPEIEESIKNHHKYQFTVAGTDIEEIKAVCLARRVNGVTEIILTKLTKDPKEYKEMCENLTKYFDATLIVEENG